MPSAPVLLPRVPDTQCQGPPSRQCGLPTEEQDRSTPDKNAQLTQMSFMQPARLPPEDWMVHSLKPRFLYKCVSGSVFWVAIWSGSNSTAVFFSNLRTSKHVSLCRSPVASVSTPAPLWVTRDFFLGRRSWSQICWTWFNSWPGAFKTVNIVYHVFSNLKSWYRHVQAILPPIIWSIYTSYTMFKLKCQFGIVLEVIFCTVYML